MSVRWTVPRALLAILALTVSGCGAETEPAAQAPDTSDAVATDALQLTSDTYDALRGLIRPTDAELAWERIDWLTSYADGLRASAAEQKPLLLWVMNGHPLGCT